MRNHPIPPPSHAKQYRAIGLVRGQYTPSDDVLTRGIFTTADNIEINAVLLGRTLSLIKNHLDLSQPHLWVVYPRTRQTGDGLHLQIAGVWDPVALGPKEVPPAAPPATDEDLLPIRDGAFSIRGEVLFYDPDEQKVIVRIEQAPRRDSEAEKSFKISLTGLLPLDKPLGHFWDIRAELQGLVLHIEAATDIGLLPPKKRSKRQSAQGKPTPARGSKMLKKPRSRDRAPRSEKPRKPS